MRIKEIKISIHRKYTRDFQSYGYRIGVMLDVGKGDDARSGYYEGKAFLNERIAEEDLIIKNIMIKKFAEKGLGYKELGMIPEKKVDRTDLGGGYKELEVREKVAEKKSKIVSYACEGCGEWIVGEKGKDGKVFCKNCGCRIYPFAMRKSLDDGSKSDVKFDGEASNIMVPYDVRRIIRTSVNAVLVELFDKKGDQWIPKSCIGDGDAMDLMQKDVKTMLRVKNWFLEKKGLI